MTQTLERLQNMNGLQLYEQKYKSIEEREDVLNESLANINRYTATIKDTLKLIEQEAQSMRSQTMSFYDENLLHFEDLYPQVLKCRTFKDAVIFIHSEGYKATTFKEKGDWKQIDEDEDYLEFIGEVLCSNCKEVLTTDPSDLDDCYAICPHCGAIIIGSEEEVDEDDRL